MFSVTRRFVSRATLVLQKSIPQQRTMASSSRPPQSDFHAVLQQLSLLARIGATAYVIQVYIASTTMSVGPSMQPTFNTTGDLLLTEYLTPRLDRLKSGDVVVATKPTDPSMSILKRVRGMPGERIRVQTGRNRPPEWLTVPDDHIWLEGDNPRQSSDSRDYGPVPICLIRGKVWARFWPISQAGWVESRVIDHSLTARERVFEGLEIVIEGDRGAAGAKAESDTHVRDGKQKSDGNQ